MQSSSIRKGYWVMYVMCIYTLVMSLSWIFLTDVVFVSDFLAFTGQSYADYLAANSSFAEIYMITKKLWGVAMLLVSLLVIFITRKSYCKGEKWSWYALLIAGVMLWGSLFGYRFVIRYVAPSIVTFLVGAVLFAIGILLPAKEILRKSS